MWAWATMTSMVENMSELLVGSYCVLIPCLTRPRITRSVTRSVPTRVASARPCVSNKKSAGPAWQLCQALDGYSLSLPKRSINRSASNLDRIKNQAIAKQSGRVHTICTNVRTPSQFVCCVGSARPQIVKCRRFLWRFVRVRQPMATEARHQFRMQFGGQTNRQWGENRRISTMWIKKLKEG